MRVSQGKSIPLEYLITVGAGEKKIGPFIGQPVVAWPLQSFARILNIPRLWAIVFDIALPLFVRYFLLTVAAFTVLGSLQSIFDVPMPVYARIKFELPPAVNERLGI